MTLSEPSSRGRSFDGAPAVSEIAARRAEGEDFSASFHELQELVRAACRSRRGWEEKVIAGIAAALEFAATRPAKARALTVNARRPTFGDSNPEQVVIDYFAGLIGEVAPDRRIPVSTDRSVVEAIAAVVRGHLLGATEDQLPAAAPDLVYLALMPYLGLEATARWAESAEPA